jgi:hypothetical protein
MATGQLAVLTQIYLKDQGYFECSRRQQVRVVEPGLEVIIALSDRITHGVVSETSNFPKMAAIGQRAVTLFWKMVQCVKPGASCRLNGLHASCMSAQLSVEIDTVRYPHRLWFKRLRDSQP